MEQTFVSYPCVEEFGELPPDLRQVIDALELENKDLVVGTILAVCKHYIPHTSENWHSMAQLILMDLADVYNW